MDSAPVVDSAHVDSIGGRVTSTNGLRPSRYPGEDKVEVSVEKPIGNLAEKFVDICEQSRGCNWEESNAVCIGVPSQDRLSFHEIKGDRLSSDILHGVDVFDVNMSGGGAGYVEKQQNHVTPEQLTQRECEKIPAGAGDGDDTVVSVAPSKVPPDIVDVSSVGLAEGATTMFELSCSANCQATDPTVSFSMLPVTCENNLTDTGSAVNMNIGNHSISDIPLSTSEVCGLDASSNRLDIALASSTVYDAISADIVDFPLHEMVDTRSVTSLSDLMPDCQDLFNTSTSGDQMLLPSSTEADFISVAPCQSVHSEQNSDTQSSTPVSHDNNSMYANSETDPDENREPLSYELQQGYRILREIMAESHKSINWPFMNPIDSTQEGCEDYYEQVKHPMWLKKMRDKFDHREYKSITEFVADMRQMLENCYRYNGPDHAISKKGQRLETMMEQKLALLSRELREKTSICATSGKPVEETKITGTRRRKVIIPHDSTALLNQLRLEAQEREREARRQLIQERKQAQEAYQQELQSWEEKLFQDGLLEQMKSMWELPQIGHFLFLCAVPLNIGEVMQWELERCFLLPRESSTMQRIMTALLSTPYQRTRLDRKPMMPYKVWEDKLRTRLRLWYKTLQDYNGDIDKASEKLGLEAKFFKVVGLRSPLERKRYHELTYYQKVWIAKGLCDWCLETQDSIREAIEAQPITEQRPYDLGTDADGFSYLHFPQFCGADLRIYKQAPVVMPEHDKATPERSVSPKKGSCKLKPTNRKKTPKSKETVSTRPRDSRLRQNPRQIAQFQVACSDTEDDGETSTQRSSAVDTTTDLDSGQESSAQDSGISEESDSNEPPSKTSKGGNGLMDNGTDVSLDLLIDATPSRLTRSLMRNLTKVFSSASTPSASRESSPAHSGQRLRARRSGRRVRKLAKSSRESSPSAHSDMHSVDGSPCSESVNISAKSRQRKRTRFSRQATKPHEDNIRVDHELERSDPTVKDECLQMTSKDVSPALSAEDAVAPKASGKLGIIKSEIKTETDNKINSNTDACKADESNFSLKVNSNDTHSGSGIPEEGSLSPENVSSVDLCETDTVSGEKDNEQCDNTAAVPQNDRTQDNPGVVRNADDNGGDQMGVGVHAPKAGIDRTSVIRSHCDLKQSDVNGELAESKDIGVTESDSHSPRSHKCVDVASESHDAEDFDSMKDVVSEACSGSIQSSAGVSAGATPDISRSPTPMDIGKEEGKAVTEVTMPKLSPVLPLPDGSPKKAALEDEISLASTISAVDPNYRPDSPQYQHLAPVKSVASDGAAASHCDFNHDDGPESREDSQVGQKCIKMESGETSIKDEPLGGDAERVVDECNPVTESIKCEADVDAQKLDLVKSEKPEIKEEEMEEEICEITAPEFDKFELVVTDLDALRQLIAKLAEVRESEVSDNKKSKMSKPNSNKRCVTELHNRLEYLLQELEPWEQKLNSLHKKAIVKMKKEQDSYVEEPEKEEIEDVWESEESASENEDSNSSNEEVEAEEEAEQGKEDQEDKNEEMEVVGVTTRGGLKRKKKVITNDSAKKKKSPETMKEHVASPSPNILQKKTTVTEQQPAKSPTVKPTITDQSKELTLAIIGNQPVLLPTSQLASLNSAVFLAQASAKSGALGVQPQIALLSSNSLGGNVLLTTQNPALLQEKTTHTAATVKGSPLVGMTQSSDQQRVLFRSPTSSQTFVVSQPPAVSSQPSVTSISKSSASAEATKPAVTCFNYSNISQLPPDVIQKLLKNQERRLQQGVVLNKTLASTQNQNTTPVSCTTAFTRLLKTGLLPVATTEIRSKPSVLQQNNISSKADGIMLVNREAVNTVASGGAGTDTAKLPVQPTMAVCTAAAASCHANVGMVTETSNAEINLLPTLNRSMADQVPVQNLAIVQNPSVLLDDRKEGPHFALLSSPPKPKYASNVTVKTLLENKHAQQKVLPGQTSSENPSSEQTSGVTVAEEQKQGILSLSKHSDGATTVAACSSKVLSAQPVRSVPLIKGYNQLPVAHAVQAVQAVQGASGQVQLVLPGRQQLMMQKPGKQVQFLPAASGKVQLMQGPDGQLHLVQTGPGQSVQLIQGAGGLQGVQVIQGSGGIQVLQAQQAPKLQVIQGTQQQQQQQQQLKVIQMPTGQRLQLITNQTVVGKTSVPPNLQVQKAIIQSVSDPKLVQQPASSNSTVAEAPQKPEDQKLLTSDSTIKNSEACSVSTEAQTLALAAQKPKLVHIGASGQKVIPLTPQVAAQLHIAMAKKQAIDQAVKTVITSVTTSLPTACIKVSSPFELPSRRPHRSVTITTPAMKAPIPAVRKDDEAKLKPVSSVIAGGCHSSPEPVQSFTVPVQHNTTGGSVATQMLPIQSMQSLAANVTTVAATAVSMAPKVHQNASSLPVKPPQQNVGLRLTAQNILTNKGLIQGVVIPAGVALSQVVLQQLKHTSETQGLSVFQQSKDGTLQQLLFSSKPATVVQPAVPQQLVRNARPQSVQLPLSVASSHVAQVVPKQVPASPHQLTVNVSTGAVNKPVILSQGHSPAKILLPAAKPIQMVLQNQQQALATVPLRQTQGTPPAVVPTTVQLLKTAKGVVPRIQLQQVLDASSGQPALLQGTQTVSNPHALQTAVVSIPQVSSNQHNIQLPVISTHFAAASQLSGDKTTLMLPGKEPVSTEVSEDIAGTAATGLVQNTPSAAAGGYVIAMPKPVSQPSGDSTAQPSGVVSFKQTSAKEQQALTQQQLLQLIQKQQVQTMANATVGEQKGSSTSTSQSITVAANLVPGSTPKQPSKLVVFNVNGKLMTAQGVPVNLTQGLVKVGNQVIGAQAGLRCQQSSAAGGQSDGSSIVQMATNNQLSSVVLPSSLAPSSMSSVQLVASTTGPSTQQLQQGHGDVASGLQVLANAANLTSSTLGQ